MTEKRYKLRSDGFLLETIFDTFEEIEMGAECATDILNEYEEENKKLKSLCKVLITHIEKNSIAFVIDEDIRRLLE